MWRSMQRRYSSNQQTPNLNRYSCVHSRSVVSFLLLWKKGDMHVHLLHMFGRTGADAPPVRRTFQISSYQVPKGILPVLPVSRQCFQHHASTDVPVPVSQSTHPEYVRPSLLRNAPVPHDSNMQRPQHCATAFDSIANILALRTTAVTLLVLMSRPRVPTVYHYHTGDNIPH